MSQQGTPEWRQARAGYVTASAFSSVLAEGRGGGKSLTRQTYMLDLAAERLTGLPSSGFKNAAMEWGTQNEPLAREAYELWTGTLVEEVGFVPHPDIEWCGSSPDGLVGDDGMIEVKCPHNSTVHLRTIKEAMQAMENLLWTGGRGSSPFPVEHYPQMQGNMWVHHRAWCDFVSFDPRFPKHLQLYVYRVHRDEKYIKALEVAVKAFLAELDALLLGLSE